MNASTWDVVAQEAIAHQDHSSSKFLEIICQFLVFDIG